MVWRLSLLVLLACLALPAVPKESAPPPTPAQLAETHGYAHAMVPQTGSIFLVPRGGRKRHELPLRGEISSFAYGEWLPAGEYDVVLRNPTGQFLDVKAADGGKYEAVTVKAGQLTDLGALLWVDVGGYEYVLLPVQHPEATAEAAKMQEFMGDVWTSKEIVPWRPSAPPQAIRPPAPNSGLGLIADLISDYARKVNKPPLSTQLKAANTIDGMGQLAKITARPRTEKAASDAAGKLYYGADFGQIRTRSPAGEWASIDTGTLANITAIGVKGERLIAATNRSEILGSTDGGKNWSRLTSFVVSEVAIDIDRAEDRWLLLVAKFGARGLSHLIVYSSTADDLSGLTVLREFPMTPGPLHVIGMADTLVGQVRGDTYYLNTADLLHKLNLVTMRWSSVKPAHRISAYSVSADGKLLTAVRIQGAFSKVSVSDDGGTSWRNYKRPPYTIYDAHMETPESGNATRWNAHAFTSTLEFLEFDPVKKDWRKTHEAPQGCVQMLRDASYAQQYCLTSGGSILSYQNGGWVVEFALN